MNDDAGLAELAAADVAHDRHDDDDVVVVTFKTISDLENNCDTVQLHMQFGVYGIDTFLTNFDVVLGQALSLKLFKAFGEQLNQQLRKIFKNASCLVVAVTLYFYLSSHVVSSKDGH